MAQRLPKYNYGLLDTSESSGLSNLDTTGFSTTLDERSFHQNPDRQPVTPNPGNTSASTGNLGSAEVSKDQSSVFQVPLQPALRKVTSSLRPTPKTPSAKILGSKSTPGATPARSSVRSTPIMKDTPRSKTLETPRAVEPSVIVTLVEGRGLARGEVGMASIDLKNPILTLSQFSDTQNYVKTMTKLQILSPIEIIFPSTMCDGGNAAPVYKIVNENFPGSNITTIQRHYFNDHNGLDFIKRLVIEENNSVVMAVKSKYYCLAAASALIKYVEFIENMVYAQESLRVVFQGGERTTMIDAGTSSILELVVNLENLKSSHSLFSVLNRTKTPGGTRLLRSNILQPLNDRETIQARLDCVEELTDSSEFFYGLQSALERFEIDIDHLIASLVQIAKQDTDKIRERRINTAILLKHVTDTVPALCESLSEGKCDLFQAYSASLKDARFCSVSDLLSNILNENCRYTKGLLNMRYQRCFAVKPGISAVLDMSRRVYSEMIEDIGELIEQLNGKYNLPLRSCHSSSRGFHVQMLTKDAPSKLPEDFIQISKTRKTLSFTTQELKKINGNIILQIKDINMITDAMIKHLNASVRSNIGCLYNLSEIVSTLDMLLSFAHYRTTTECVRPEFTDTLAIKNGRHPVLDNGRRCYVPSNVYAAEGKNFNIVTGPNMSGKTTYLKMIAQLQVMAQMGCFVPAEFASFRVASQIFSRVGSNDDMETNSSTFMVEMKEVNYIIQNVTDTSVVIIDELGRGTSSEEGVGLCWAISEFLLSEKAFTFFATHFIELCRMESIYPNIENYHFEIKHVTCNQGRFRTVQFTYALSRGFTREVHYGLDLAEMFDLPPSLIQKAHVIADEIDKRAGEADASVTDEQKANNAAYKFATRLLQVSRSSRLDDVALVEYVRGLRNSYLNELDNLSVCQQTNNDPKSPRGSRVTDQELPPSSEVVDPDLPGSSKVTDPELPCCSRTIDHRVASTNDN